jgi:hypothetical protein
MTGRVEQGGGWRGNRWRIAVWSGLAGLLLPPLVAMQFTREVAWSPFDFAIFGAMLAAAGGGYELAVRMSNSIAYRAAAAIAIVAGFLLVWMNLAVGIIGAEDNPANLMFAGVLAVGVVGAAIARLRPQGLAWTLVAMALAQALVGAIAWSAGVWILTGAFAAAWLLSAWLFRMAAKARR